MSERRPRPMVTVGDGPLRVLSPSSPLLADGPGSASGRGLAPRLATLEGAVLAVIDNGFNSPDFPRAIVGRLESEAGIAEVIWVKKDSVSVPPRPEDWEQVINRATAGLTLYGG